MAKRGPKPKEPEAPSAPEMTVISIKTTAAFRDWLSSVAETERITVVQFLEKAAVEAAERRKFPTPAPRRTVGR
jgi:hypothetical protein